jgi:hypothetical protein
MSPDITRESLDKHVHSRLRTRIRLYLGISIAIIIAILYRVVVEGGGILYPLTALVIGIAAGVLLSRMFNVSWDKDAEKVVSRIDVYGGILLVVYIIFELSGEDLIRHWFNGSEVLTLILSLAGGAVLGRGLGMAGKMFSVLRSNI